jgi:RNA polymerase sigma-70 factor, ECF subfamily
MTQLTSPTLHELLVKWGAGDQQALATLVPLVYHELHRLAHHYLRGERSDHTLQTTALIHEAYVRLTEQGPFQTENRAHFVAVAATLMRQILVDYARQRGAVKRGADCLVIVEDDCDHPFRMPDFDLLALDYALKRLIERDPQQGRIVELRFFGGLTVEETATVLGISPATVKRDWSMARAWLRRQIKRGESGDSRSLDQD